MPEFQYQARDASGQAVSGAIDASTERDALAQLTQRSLFPTRVTATGAQRQARSRGKRVSGQLLATFYSQLASLLRSGVPLLKSLRILQEQSSNQTFQTILDDVDSRVEDGMTLADAMERHERAFRSIAVNMVRAGSEGGFLEDALDRVARFTEEQEDLKSRTVGALAYPIFLSVVGTIVVIVLITYFVPSFAELFERLRERGELPWPTEALLWVSDTLNRYGLLLLGTCVGLGVLAQRQWATERGRRAVDRFVLHIPILGDILLRLALARICRVLGTLLQNGVPILRSLEISQQAAGNLVLGDVLQDAAANISSGDPLAKPLARSPYFPRELVEMISVAEESNTLENVLVDIADRLELRTARRLDLFVRLLEPILLLLLAVVVLLVVIALLMPIMKMSSTI